MPPYYHSQWRKAMARAIQEEELALHYRMEVLEERKVYSPDKLYGGGKWSQSANKLISMEQQKLTYLLI
jgi:hypothetical protein